MRNVEEKRERSDRQIGGKGGGVEGTERREADGGMKEKGREKGQMNRQPMGGKTAVAEDKSPKGTWIIPTAIFLGACVQMALIAGWVWYPGLDIVSAEFFMRGFWADYLPPRLRRFLYPGMKWKGRFVPYYQTGILTIPPSRGEYLPNSVHSPRQLNQ